MDFQIRHALTSDYGSIKALIASSARTLGKADYSSAQIEGALQSAFGLDTQLITDKTYFVVEKGASIVACGGWSFRQTLFGSDMEKNRCAERINPFSGAAKIRAFFVSPRCARMGVGTMILNRCELEAYSAGFRKLELMATLPGVRLYEKRGFVAGKPIQYPVGGQLTIEFIPMSKDISGVG